MLNLYRKKRAVPILRTLYCSNENRSNMQKGPSVFFETAVRASLFVWEIDLLGRFWETIKTYIKYTIDPTPEFFFRADQRRQENTNVFFEAKLQGTSGCENSYMLLTSKKRDPKKVHWAVNFVLLSPSSSKRVVCQGGLLAFLSKKFSMSSEMDNQPTFPLQKA